MITELRTTTSARTTDAHPLIRMTNVRKVYRKRKEEFLAVSDVTMDIYEGDMVSLVGPSGCGKSTLLKILSGLHGYDGGTVEVGGTAGADFKHGRDVGMVFQQPLLLKWRTVLENVLLPADILGLDRKASTERAHELLEMVGLVGFADKMPYELSGGMQQRAAIARALIHDPKLVLMDEPFGALDALTREKMNLEMLRIWERSRKTFVVVTHSIQEAVFLGSRCAVLTSGPARMADFFPIELSEPRKLNIKTTPEFGEYVRRIYELLGVE
jgi:NitT/TauT family transport system ATP-binding protein